MFCRTRNRKKIFLNKRFVILAFCLLISLIIFYLLINFVYMQFKVKSNFEKDIILDSLFETSDIFKLTKIVLFSSANATNNETTRDLWNLNIYQYTDIAIYLDNNGKTSLNEQNTVKELYLDNISFGSLPSKGTPMLYYKDIKAFGNSDLFEYNKIDDRLVFNIINYDENLDTSKPNFYNTCQIPITAQFVNNNVKENAIIPNNGTSLKFDGSLLSKANIALNSILCNLSFNINIVNNLNEKFVYNVSFSIPLEDGDRSIYDGYVKQELTFSSDSCFLKIM